MSKDCEITIYTVEIIRSQKTGALVSERWFKDNQLHRDDDLPATIGYINGILWQHWYQHGEEHRESMPAVLATNSTGMVLSEVWCRAGKRHREGGLPAYILRNADGILRREEYTINGLFRTDGPAVISYNRLGRVYRRYYSRDGHTFEMK